MVLALAFEIVVIRFIPVEGIRLVIILVVRHYILQCGAVLHLFRGNDMAAVSDIVYAIGSSNVLVEVIRSFLASFLARHLTVVPVKILACDIDVVAAVGILHSLFPERHIMRKLGEKVTFEGDFFRG